MCNFHFLDFRNPLHHPANTQKPQIQVVYPSSPGSSHKVVRIIPVSANSAVNLQTPNKGFPTTTYQVIPSTSLLSSNSKRSLSSPLPISTATPLGSNRKAIVAHVSSQDIQRLPKSKVAQSVVSNILGSGHTSEDTKPKFRTEHLKFTPEMAKPDFLKLTSTREIVPKSLTRNRSEDVNCELKPAKTSDSVGMGEDDLTHYATLTKRLSSRCSDMSSRAYRSQIERKRELLKEQIDLELMFERNKVPLSRQIYELPYTSVIQRQLLPEDDNDPNISFESSSESDHDLDNQQQPYGNQEMKFEICDKVAQTTNLISTGKRSALSRQAQEKRARVSVKKEQAEKRKIVEKDVEDIKHLLKQSARTDPEGLLKIHNSRKEAFRQISENASKAEKRLKQSQEESLEIVSPENTEVVKKKRRKVEENVGKTKGSQLRFGDTETLHCVCRTIYDHKKFYVKCDLCLNWLHGKCVGIDGRAAKKLTEFVCPACSENCNKNELFCICQTPYDESKFYIGCDECGDWLHGACVGINPDDAQNIDSYFCPRCKKDDQSFEEKDASLSFRLEDEHFELLMELMSVLMSHTHSWPFVEPSTDVEYPGYSSMVPNPICK